jgi:hypothetical protein
MIRYLLLFLYLSATAFAELTPDQKAIQFRQLAGLYSKNYAPYEWKRDTQNFDLLQLGPWLERARETKDDLDFADVMMEYVASLNDGHDILTLRSTYYAYLGFSVDYYDGKPLIDFLTRALLPRAAFPFDIGDELISVDGLSPEEMTVKYRKYSIAANDLTTKRQSAEWYTFRPQSLIPRAHELGDNATVIVRRAATGANETYTIPWFKTGTPMLTFGTLPSNGTASTAARTARGAGGESQARRIWNQMLNQSFPRAKDLHTVNGVGVVAPLFALPTGFTQRLGRSTQDVFYSGTYPFEGKRIGYIRIPDFAPASQALAVQQFVTEIQYFQANTDGLVIDIMRNPGGSLAYTNFLISTVMPDYHRVIGYEIRATSFWVSIFSQLTAESEDFGDPPWVIATYREILGALTAANSENRGRTGAVALDSGPDFEATLDRPPFRIRGINSSYTKPLIVLADEFTASGGDAFAAMVQDNQRGPVFGKRTMGLGGNVIDWSLDGYAEVDTRITTSLMVRKAPVSTGGQYPVTAYIENVGVHPDIEYDYMTEDNLRNRGRTYVEAFSKALVSSMQPATTGAAK